jgi:hypothetical protein
MYTINTPNSGLSGFTGPYGTATVDLVDSTHASITFASLTNGGYQYLMGGAQVADVNVNAASWSVGSIAWTNYNLNGAVTNGGSNTADGWGTFNQTFDAFDGFSNSKTEISFLLTNTSGSWVDSGSVLTANSDGNTVAMHAFACCTLNSQGVLAAAATGFATNTPAIPEPETYAMMLVGFGLLGFVARRRKQGLGNAVPA